MKGKKRKHSRFHIASPLELDKSDDVFGVEEHNLRFVIRSGWNYFSLVRSISSFKSENSNQQTTRDYTPTIISKELRLIFIMRHFFFQCDVHHLTDIKAIVLFEKKICV